MPSRNIRASNPGCCVAIRCIALQCLTHYIRMIMHYIRDQQLRIYPTLSLFSGQEPKSSCPLAFFIDVTQIRQFVNTYCHDTILFILAHFLRIFIQEVRNTTSWHHKPVNQDPHGCSFFGLTKDEILSHHK
jgi:hypothetical protein